MCGNKQKLHIVKYITCFKYANIIYCHICSKFSVINNHMKDISSLKKLIAIENDARNFGFEWESANMILEQSISEAEEVRQAIQQKETPQRIQEEVGDLLHTAISLCIYLGYDIEQTLDYVSNKFGNRMKELKIAAQKRDLNSLKGKSTKFMLELWDEVKQLEKI